MRETKEVMHGLRSEISDGSIKVNIRRKILEIEKNSYQDSKEERLEMKKKWEKKRNSRVSGEEKGRVPPPQKKGCKGRKD